MSPLSQDAHLGAFASIDLRSMWNILVVKLDHIGDWLLCTPFLENLRRNAPQAQITGVVRKNVLELAAFCPFLDRAIGIEAGWAGIGACRTTSEEATGFCRDFALGSFDLAIVPRWDVDFDGAGRLAHDSGAPLVVGFAETTTPRKRLLNHGADRFYTHLVAPPFVAHEVEQNLRLLECMNGQVTTRRTSLDTTAWDQRRAEQLLGGYRRPLLGLAPFASEAKRMLPLERLAIIARSLQRRFGVDIVILGEDSDRAAAAALASTIGPSARSFCGQLTLRQTAEIIRRCSVLIGMDSGPAHIAAAVDTPAAVLSCHPAGGATDHPNSPTRFAPWTTEARRLVLQPAAPLSPCRDACAAAEPHCIAKLDIDSLVGTLGRFVEHHLPAWRPAASVVGRS